MSAGATIDLAAVRYHAGQAGGAAAGGASAGGAQHPETGVLEEALKDVHLEIEPGECVLLTGPSGGGKSTLLRLLNGTIPHYYSAEIDGRVVLDPREALDKTIGGEPFAPPEVPLWHTGLAASTVFQNPRTQFFTTDVTSELAFALENRAVEPSVIRARIADVADEVGINDLLDRSLFALSGGERQLVACASAVVARPGLYLFDEPTSNLSPEAIEHFADFLRHLKATGATIVIAEHRLYFLRGIIDRGVVVNHGIVKDAPAAEFFAMSDGERAELGLRELTEPQVAQGLAEAAEIAGAAGIAGAPSPSRSGSGITLEHVTAGYGRKHTVLRDLNLSFERGSVSAIVGPNGAGKSTLASVICGLKKAKGTVSLDGTALGDRERLARSYLVMQDVHRQLFADSVRAEILLGVAEGADGTASVDADALLAEFDLSDYDQRHPLSLSGGQKQRLVVAAATALDRDVYIFDEPSSGLDRAHLDAVAATLRKLAAAQKVVLLITHDPELINACADRVVEIEKL